MGISPDVNCASLQAYLTDFVGSMAELDVLRYAVIAGSPDSATLSSLWVECVVPDSATAIILNTDTNEYEIWSYIAGVWTLIHTGPGGSAYFTDFLGNAGPVGDNWVGTWELDGAGSVMPVLSYGANLLLNPDFENWAAGAPVSWTVTGTVGQSAIQVYSGASSVLIQGVGAPPANSIAQNVVVTRGLWFKFGSHSYRGNTYSYIASNWLGIGAAGTVPAVWNTIYATDFSLTTTATPVIGIQLNVPGSNGYADLASLEQISGVYLYRELYGATGYFEMRYTLGSVSTHCGLLLNYTDSDNYILVVADSGSIYVIEHVAGVPVLRRTVSYTYVAGAALGVYRYAPEILDIYYNGALVVAGVGLVTNTVSTQHGIVATEDNTLVHDFSYIPL